MLLLLLPCPKVSFWNNASSNVTPWCYPTPTVPSTTVRGLSDKSLQEPRNMLWESGDMALIEMEGTLLGLLEKAMLLHAAPGAALGLGRTCDIFSTVVNPV